MAASLSFNPSVQTNATGLFNATSVGYIQGLAEDDPAYRNWLRGGVLATTETLPMWGGVGISAATPGVSGNPAAVLGPLITRATKVSTTGAAGSLTGFSVLNQNYSAIITPQSKVPLSGSGQQVNFYELGSNARIPVACAASLISNAPGVIETQQVSWDFVAQELVPYTAFYAADTITNAVWASTGGGQVSFTVSSDISSDVSAGSIIDVSGVVNTGGAGTDVFNGTFVVLSADSTHVVVSYAASGSPGTYASGGSIASAGGALPVRVLRVNGGNSMTVSYNAKTGFATWNNSGNVALIQI